MERTRPTIKDAWERVGGAIRLNIVCNASYDKRGEGGVSDGLGSRCIITQDRNGCREGGVYIIITVDVDGLGSRHITNAMAGWRLVITVDACVRAKQQAYYSRRSEWVGIRGIVVNISKERDDINGQGVVI